MSSEVADLDGYLEQSSIVGRAHQLFPIWCICLSNAEY
jgi:hypothetical protein